MTTAAKSFLLPEEDPELRRWLMAAAFVAAAHGALALWLMNKHDVNLAGTPPAAIMIELAPLDVTPGPQVTQAEPEEVEPPQTITVPELPPLPKPAVVLMTPAEAKAKTEKNRQGNTEASGETGTRAARAAHQRAAPRGGASTTHPPEPRTWRRRPLGAAPGRA